MAERQHITPWVPLLAFGVALGAATRASAFSAGIASNQFGATGCNQCHSGGVRPQVSLTGPSNVAPSETNEYLLQIEAGGSQNKGGLNVAATGGTLATGGSASSQTRLVSGTGGLAEVTHMSPKNAAGGVIAFSFLWTAPAVEGSVSLTAWGNAVDGSGDSFGDKADFDILTVAVDATPATPTPCEATPAVGCRAVTRSRASLFQLKDNADDAKDKLIWKWTRGVATSLADFGDPVTGSTSYTLCVYDESGATPQLIMSPTAPAAGVCAGKPCWKAIATGYKYKDKDRSHDGLFQILLKQGDFGKAKIIVKGKGANLPMPAPVTPGLLAQDSAVTVQLHNSDGVCWEAVYSAPAKKNDPTQFKDKSD